LKPDKIRLLFTPPLGHRLFALCSILALLLAACSGGSAPPTPTPEPEQEVVQLQTNLSTTSYRVQGSTTEAIFSYIERNGPTDGIGKRGSGITSVVWGYEWTGEEKTGSCRIKAMTVKAEMTVTLPEHADEASLGPGILTNWRSYTAGVAQHEQRHVDIYLEGAEVIKERMEAIGSLPSCRELEQTIDRIWKEEQERINELQELFHVEEDLRLEASRGPLEAKINANRDELASIQRRINQLDTRLTEVRAEIAGLDTQVENVDAQIRQINEQFPGALPAGVRQRMEELVQQRNDLTSRYNQRVDEHNSALAQRGELARTHASLVEITNELVEEFNWAR
jgi:predicted secreted Zn-dependent protease